MLKGIYMGATGELHKYYNVLQGCYKGVTGVLHKDTWDNQTNDNNTNSAVKTTSLHWEVRESRSDLDQLRNSRLNIGHVP